MSIIKIDTGKCVGCNSCVRVCPTVDANRATLDELGNSCITIDDSKCIKCGACIEVCIHGARTYGDDTELFFEALKKKEEVILIAAPAVKVAFEGNWGNVLRWMKEQGVSKIYDVGFGADICTWAHVRYLQQHPETQVISQPCAAIVNYALRQEQRLIPYLLPIQSPMTCLAIYIREKLGYKGKIAALSPCIAKTDEFKDTGFIDYNVTIKHIQKFIDDKKIDIPFAGKETDFEFDGEESFEGSIYSKPGGLMQNLLLHLPELSIITSEGTERVYEDLQTYLEQDKLHRPAVFDVLNCATGCNGGPGIGKKENCFEINHVMHDLEFKTKKQRLKNTNRKGIDLQFNCFDKNLRIEDYVRTYKAVDNKHRNVNNADIEKVFITMGKNTEIEKHFDCHACGFDTCEEMASAISLGLNARENCHQYMLKSIREERQQVADINQQVLTMNQKLTTIFHQLILKIEYVKNEAGRIGQAGSSSAEKMSQVGNDINVMENLNHSIVEAMGHIEKNIDSYRAMTGAVEGVANKINLLSLNASIEAARAGDAGKGFAVVSSNIQVLSQNSKQAVGSARENDDAIHQSMMEVTGVLNNFQNNMQELINVVEESSREAQLTKESSDSICGSMEELDEMASKVNQIIEHINEIL